MSSVQHLRELIKERLTAAAEEIFTEFQKTIVQYEDVIDRQRRLLDISWKPEIKLHRAVRQSLGESLKVNPTTHAHTQVSSQAAKRDLPQQRVCEEEEIVAHQQLTRDFSLDQEEAEPPQIKEEPEEVCTSQEETDTFIVTVPYDESDHSEPEPDRDLLLPHSSDSIMLAHSKSKEILEIINNSTQNKEEIEHQQGLLDITWNAQTDLHRTGFTQKPVCQEEGVLCDQERSSSVAQEETEPPEITEELEELCTSQEGELLVLKEETDTFMVTAPYEESDYSDPEPSQSNDAEDFLMSESQCSTSTGKKSVTCDVCGKAFMNKYILKEHYRIHTGEKPYSCETCGKSFTRKRSLLVHMKIHTGEKPYSCQICGKNFTERSSLLVHMRIHTGEKLFSCGTCGKRFSVKSSLLVHIKRHTGEKPYICNSCGKRFPLASSLERHKVVHTGEKPYSCKICGKGFTQSSSLLVHMRIHTGERPYNCKTCGKMFRQRNHLLVHIKTHAGEKS